MRRLLSLVLLSIVPLAAGCILFFVDHPDSTTVGSTIDINVVLVSESTPGGAQTPVACIAYPASWGSVRSATYTAEVGGINSIAGTGVLAAAEAVEMNSSYAFTTGGELAAWQCFAGAYTNYGGDSYGTATFQVDVGSSGIYTLQYSVGTVEEGPDESIASKSLAINTSLDSLDRWYVSSLDPKGDTSINRVVYGNGIFVAAGADSGNIALTSANGRDWVSTTVPLFDDVYGLTYGSGQFLALDDSGIVARSSDGSSWMETSSIGFPTRGAAFGTGIFVAVGEGGLVAVSSDGAVWTTNQASPVDTVLFWSVTYGGGKFSAVGYDGTNAIAYASTNGTTWTGVTLTSITNTLYDIAYGNDRYVAVGSEGRIMWSPNGFASWNLVTSGTSISLVGITWDGSTFVAVGGNGTILTSIDGDTWIKRSSGTGATLIDVAAGDGGFVAVGEGGVILRHGLAVPSGGGGGGGGCSTAGPVGPIWPDLLWIVMLGGIFLLRRWRIHSA